MKQTLLLFVLLTVVTYTYDDAGNRTARTQGDGTDITATVQESETETKAEES